MPGVDDIEILQPGRLYERTGRDGDYAAMVAKMKRERSEYLASFDGLDPLDPQVGRLTQPDTMRAGTSPGTPAVPAPADPDQGRPACVLPLSPALCR